MRWWAKIAATFAGIWAFETAGSTYNNYDSYVLTNPMFWLLILIKVLPAVVVFVPLYYYGFRANPTNQSS